MQESFACLRLRNRKCNGESLFRGKLMKNISYIDTRSRIRYNCTVSSPAARHRLFLGLFIGKHLLPFLLTHTHTNLGAYLCPGGSPDPPTVVRCHFDFRSTCATRRRCFHLAVCILQMHLYVSICAYLQLHLYL